MRVDDLISILSYGEDVNKVSVFIRSPYVIFLNVWGYLSLGACVFLGVRVIIGGLRLRHKDTFISTQIRYQNNTNTFILTFTFYLLLTIKV